MIPQRLEAWLGNERGQRIVQEEGVAGGCISNGSRIFTDDGESYFLKQNDAAPDDMFEAEFGGLELLRSGAGPVVPEPLLADKDFLLVEDLRPTGKGPDWDSTLGAQLADMHQRRGDFFGLDRNNYIGSTPQVNDQTRDGYEFFAEHRLGYQTRLARDAKLISSADARKIDAIAAKLPQIVPEQAASLLHGDLWSGNAISDRRGMPAIIDPAVHYGWPEAELGMTMLFGGFGENFFRAYEENADLESGWRERLDIYNLYHLINHLNLFGNSYHGQVLAVVRAYS